MSPIAINEIRRTAYAVLFFAGMTSGNGCGGCDPRQYRLHLSRLNAGVTRGSIGSAHRDIKPTMRRLSFLKAGVISEKLMLSRKNYPIKSATARKAHRIPCPATPKRPPDKRKSESAFPSATNTSDRTKPVAELTA